MSAVAAPKDSARNTEVFSPPQEVEFRLLALDLIKPSPYQTRTAFDEAELLELGENIREHGLLEPLVVRPPNPEGRYDLIAGERRLRAMRMVGILNAAVTIRDVDDRTAQSLVLIENLHRRDLDPIDEATGYKALAELGMTQAEIGEAINRSQPAIANAMRLLELPEGVLAKIRAKELSPAHGRALVPFAKWPTLCSKVADLAVANGYTSKRLEEGFGYNGLQPYEINGGKAKLIVEVDRDLDEKDLRAAGLTIFKGGYARYTPDVAEYATVAARLGKERSEAQKQAQKELKARVKEGTITDAGPIQLTDINRDQYRSLWGTAPAGCTEACPCRAKGVDSYGEEVAFCADPKRFDGLKKAEEKAAKDGKRESLQKHLYHAEMEALGQIFPGGDGHMHDLTDMDRKGMATLAFYALSRLDMPTRKAAFKRYTDVDPSGLDWDTWGYGASGLSSTLSVLQAIHPAGLVHIALYGLVKKELADRYTGYGSKTPLTDWLAGPVEGDNGAPPIESPADEDLNADPAVARARLTAMLVDYEVLGADEHATDEALIDFAQDLLHGDDVDDETASSIAEWIVAIGEGLEVAS